MLNLYQHVNSPEARLYLSRQLFEEAVHVQFNLTLLDTYVPDEAERAQAFAAVENIPSIARKARFCFTWIDSVYQLRELRTAADRRAFLLNLICFAACIEGLFFYGAFAYVYFLRSRGLLTDPAPSSHGLHGSEKDGPSATCKKSSNVMSKASICGQEGRTRGGTGLAGEQPEHWRSHGQRKASAAPVTCNPNGSEGSP